MADELSRLTTLNYTLNVGVCSFYQNGCRPFVNYAGGTGFPWQRNAQLARDLIAAGADVEEIFNDPSNNGARTPLLYIAQNGSPEVINIFLDNGAILMRSATFSINNFFGFHQSRRSFLPERQFKQQSPAAAFDFRCARR